ncbi:MAG: ATP-dependent helicase [Myroides sp.]
MTDLNDSQRRAATFEGKHLLVLAGAGTGKTKTIVARAKYLLNNGVEPNKIAIVSFTRKSAREIAERLKLSVSGNMNKNAITGKTFHSWCNEIMHQYPEHFPHHSFTPLDEDDRLSAFALAIGRNLKDSTTEKIKKETVAAVYSYAVNTLCSLTDAIFHIRYVNSDKDDEQIKKRVEEDKLIIAPIIKKYIEYKKERRYMDYDDMLNVVAQVLEKNESVRTTVTTRYVHVLVDEMQDTNPLQYKLLCCFTEKSHLFCVGDDAQSIYAFRGADFKTIHSFVDAVPQSELQKLELNYRSTQEILDLSNWVLAQSPLNYNKNLTADRGKGEKPQLIHIEDDWEEADTVTDTILQTLADGGTYSDSMVLGRSGWSLSKVEGACLTKKIPYVKLGGTSLMQSAHVRDVVSAMRIAANIYDEIAWIRYLQLWQHIGTATAAKIITEIITLDNFEQMMDRLQLSGFKGLNADVLNTLKNIRKFINNPSKAMHEAVNHMKETLEKKYSEEWSYRAADFEVLQEVAKGTGTITEFITEYVLDPKAETTFKFGKETEEDVVTLSTIHSAKGLEAKTVHVLNVNPYNYPSPRTIKQGGDAVEEERRCLYVALTRAKDRLYLYRFIRSLHTQSSENDKEQANLYFLNGLPTDLVTIKVNGREQKDFTGNNEADLSDFDFPDFDFD